MYLRSTTYEEPGTTRNYVHSLSPMRTNQPKKCVPQMLSSQMATSVCCCPRFPVPLSHLATYLRGITAVSPSRLLEEQEREEKSKAESLRLLRNSGDTTADAPPAQASSGAGAAEGAGRAAGGDNGRSSGGALGEIEIPQLRMMTDAEEEEQQQRSRLFSPDGGASDSGFSDGRFASMEEDGGGNFEDEFDPILASIRKPPQRQQPARTAAAAVAAAAAAASTPPPRSRTSSPPAGERKQDSPSPSPAHDAGRPSAGTTFAAGFLSMLPGDMRARAGEVMAQSSARISESADAIRSALESGRVPVPSAADRSKRRQSDGGNPDLEDGRGGSKGGGGRRAAAGGEGDDEEVRLLNVNELLSEEEVRGVWPLGRPVPTSLSVGFILTYFGKVKNDRQNNRNSSETGVR